MEDGVFPHLRSLGNPRERAEVTVLPSGDVEVVIGTLASGQGHVTSFAQCVSDWLGVPFDRIRLIQGDTDLVPVGGGSHSGRSMRMAGFVMGKASDAVIAKAKRIAAVVLEAPDGDMEFVRGIVRGRGSNQALSLAEIATIAHDRADLPDDLKGRLAAVTDHLFKEGGFPYGSHVCEVEIDAETGHLTLERYAAVDDVGRAINPMILHGQTHGGIAHGIGQPLKRREDMLVLALRRRQRSAGGCVVHGLRDAAGRYAPVVRHRDQRGAVADQSARYPGRWRRRHDARAWCGDQRGGRCAGRVRCGAHGHAGDAREDLEGDAGDARWLRLKKLWGSKQEFRRRFLHSMRPFERDVRGQGTHVGSALHA